MHGGFIVNPRRTPRAPARCRVTATASAGIFQAETEDLGAHGCQLVSPRLARVGDLMQLEISNELVLGRLRVSGRVAWVGAHAPWRLGVAFEEPGLAQARDWFERLVVAHPGLGAFRRIPDRISLEALVYLGPPPRFLADFTREEVTLLRATGEGIRLGELRRREGEHWATAQRALYSLMARQHLTLSRGASVGPWAWSRILEEAERALAAEQGADVGGPPAGPARGGGAGVGGGPAATPVPRRPTPPPAAQPAARRAPDFTGAGVGWRGAARQQRPAEAQECLDRAREETAAGRLNGALALLRRALALAPGDPEIAGELGKLAFKDGAT